MVVIPERFSVSYLKKILSTWRFHEFLYFFDEVDDVDTNETISVSVDSSDPLLELYIKRAVSDSLDDIVEDVSHLCKEHLNDGGIDLKMFHLDKPTVGFEDSDYRDFLTPGMMVLIIYFLAMALTGELRVNLSVSRESIE